MLVSSLVWILYIEIYHSFIHKYCNIPCNLRNICHCKVYLVKQSASYVIKSSQLIICVVFIFAGSALWRWKEYTEASKQNAQQDLLLKTCFMGFTHDFSLMEVTESNFFEILIFLSNSIYHFIILFRLVESHSIFRNLLDYSS